ncbi:N-acetyl-beta-D-galactosaminidase [Fragilaria crotonensis]|nr:N-acetyl-beta-D-galactosaminidase [Fragilaria crotonensis]
MNSPRRSSRQRRPSPLLQLGRLRNPSQKDETDGEVNASEERERNQATALQQSNEEVAGEAFVVEATQLAKEVDANMKEKWQPMYPEEGNVAIAGSQPLGSNVTFRINHEQHAGAHGLSPEDLAKITPKTNLPNEREEFVRSTRSDPDGLKQQLAMHWNTVQCDYDEALAPPKIQLQHPLIEVAREGNRTTHTGILIDAARHFFPLPWLYELIDFIAVLGFDLIHFRLTDDQSFVVQLDCHPQLATSAHFNRTSEVYTAQELRQLVRFAKDRGVSIMPELNIPGHAGAWSGIPGMLYPCTNFICDRSYSIPLRIDQPMVLQVIEDVLKEILDIFDTSPYLHLGGDEVFMSDPCFTELQIWPNFQKFEDALREMLGRLNVNPKNVVRWETTGKDDLSTFPSIARVKGKHLKRAGEVTHWWHNVPIKEEDLKQPFFMSTNLYFDMSKDKDAWDIATIAAARYALNPTAVIAATFELGPCSFQVRNVLGKLIAVAMASRKDMSKTREAFLADYRTLCLKMGLADDFCVLEGRPQLPTYLWKPTHSVLQKAWSATICERMTYPAMSFRIRRKDTATHVHRSTDIEIAHTRATELRKEIAKTEEVRRFSIAKDPIYQFATNHTGVMVDLAHQFFTIEELRHIIDFVSKLGFNLLHVRLVENESFPIQMLEYGHLSLQQKRYTGYYTEDALRQLVEYAAFRGVRLMPEINFLSNAGGWLQSGSLVNCPNYICDVGGPIPMDVNHGGTLLTVSVVCGLILQIFSTSPFLHLGSVDPVQAEPCYREAYPLGDIDVRKTFHVFEETILSVFQSMGVEKSRIVTRESSFDQLLGGVVHFTQKTPDDGSVTSPFLLSTGVSIESMEDDNAWQIYRQTLLSRKSGAMGVIVDTKGMDSKEWESQNVLGRLIAVAAALSDREEMDEVVFGSHYNTICGKLGIPPAKCSSFGKPVSNATDWAKTRDSEATERKKAQCKRFTSKGVTRLPKESIFVINPRI